MAKDKVRIRKAPTTSEQADAKASAQPIQLPVVKNRLPGVGLGRSVGRLLAVIFRPLKPLLRPLRLLVPTYFINSWREVRQVSWPNRRETWRLTLAVFIFAIVFGAIVAAVDKGLDELFKKVILKQ